MTLKASCKFYKYSGGDMKAERSQTTGLEKIYLNNRGRNDIIEWTVKTVKWRTLTMWYPESESIWK